MSEEEYIALAREVIATCPPEVIKAIREEGWEGCGKTGVLMGRMMRGCGDGRVMAGRAEGALRGVLGLAKA